MSKGAPWKNCVESASALPSALNGDLWLVLHLMIAGRLHWRPRDAKLAGRQNLAAFDFPNGSLVLTEAGSKHRASLHLVSGEEALRCIRRRRNRRIRRRSGCTFRAVLTAENHTLKRALTDPRLLSGIGNAYSDEILHAAQLSPITLTNKLTARRVGETVRGNAADSATLDRLDLVPRRRNAFPEKVTAFRKDMAIHGRYGLPCPRCGDKILADSLCGQGNQLLCALPDGRKSSGGSKPVAAAWDQTGRALWKSWKP